MEEITSVQNNKIKQMNKLKKKKERVKQGQFLIEGFHFQAQSCTLPLAPYHFQLKTLANLAPECAVERKQTLRTTQRAEQTMRDFAPSKFSTEMHRQTE